MAKLLGRFQEPAYSLARFAFGVLFAFHGAQKLFGLFGKQPAGSPLMWVAGGVEFFGGLAVAVGFFTSWAAFLCAGQMLVAYFYVHAGRGLLPINNGGEPALLYFFAFLLIATRGSGKYAVRKGS